MVWENDAGYSCRLGGNTTEVSINHLTRCYCHSAHYRPSVHKVHVTLTLCRYVHLVCLWANYANDCKNPTYATSSDTWTNLSKLNLCTVTCLGKMVELDQSHDSHASDQGKMRRGGEPQRDEEWQRLRRRMKGREAVGRMKRRRSNENTVEAHNDDFIKQHFPSSCLLKWKAT